MHHAVYNLKIISFENPAPKSGRHEEQSCAPEHFNDSDHLIVSVLDYRNCWYCPVDSCPRYRQMGRWNKV